MSKDFRGADLLAYNVDIAVICETHLKKKHFDHSFVIDGYSLFRRDRLGRRGGGVAVYVSSRMSAEVWTPPCDNIDFELLWVTIQAGGRNVKFSLGRCITPRSPSISLFCLLIT